MADDKDAETLRAELRKLIDAVPVQMLKTARKLLRRLLTLFPGTPKIQYPDVTDTWEPSFFGWVIRIDTNRPDLSYRVDVSPWPGPAVAVYNDLITPGATSFWVFIPYPDVPAGDYRIQVMVEPDPMNEHEPDTIYTTAVP